MKTCRLIYTVYRENVIRLFRYGHKYVTHIIASDLFSVREEPGYTTTSQQVHKDRLTFAVSRNTLLRYDMLHDHNDVLRPNHMNGN